MPAQTDKPFVAEQRSGYWILVDSRTGDTASYPVGTKRACKAEADIMNRAYAEAVAEQVSA